MLAAQFESLRDPLVIMVSVPMAIVGALIPLFFGVATMNIYTQVGLLTLVGLITKHGILMVEFANELQLNEGLDKRSAIEMAARIRLRPILMTTAAMVTGLIPLLTASGAGAASRFSIGLVVVAGMSIGTLFTLFVLPAVYVTIATDHQAKRSSERTRQIAEYDLDRQLKTDLITFASYLSRAAASSVAVCAFSRVISCSPLALPSRASEKQDGAMKRREFLAMLGGAALAAPAAGAGREWADLSSRYADAGRARSAPTAPNGKILLKALAERGYVLGQNLTLEAYGAMGDVAKTSRPAAGHENARRRCRRHHRLPHRGCSQVGRPADGGGLRSRRSRRDRADPEPGASRRQHHRHFRRGGAADHQAAFAAEGAVAEAEEGGDALEPATISA